MPDRTAPLARAEAQRWQLQEFANRVPSKKELEVRQALARTLDAADAAAEEGGSRGR